MNYYQEFLNRSDCILLLVDIQKSMLDLCVDRERTVLNAGPLSRPPGFLGFPLCARCTILIS